MNSTFVTALKPNANVPVSYSRLYLLPGRDQSETNDAVDDEAQPIGWDRRYGMLFFSERALLYGPYSVASADEKFILSQFPNFMRDRGKRCLYRIFEAYTAVKLERSGLRARPRDPATDRVYYFPCHYPSCIALSVLHFDGNSCRTCAALVYKFRTAEVAALAFKMLTETNSVPRRRRISLSPTTIPVAPILTKNSPTRSSLHRNGSTRRIQERETRIALPHLSMQQLRSRQIDVHSSPHWNESNINFKGPRNKRKSPPKIPKGQFKRRGKSRSGGQKQQIQPRNQNCCCCNHHCIHHVAGKNCNSAGKGVDSEDPKIGNGTMLIINGKRYPLSLLHELMNQLDERVSTFRISKEKSTSSSNRDNSSSVSKVSIDNNSADLDSESSESVVELVFDKLKNKSKLNGTEMTFRNLASDRSGMRGDVGGNSVTVIRLSRQGNSDSEREDDGNGGRYPAPPTKILGDGTTIYNLYRRQRSEDSKSKQFNNSTFAADGTPDENIRTLLKSYLKACDLIQSQGINDVQLLCDCGDIFTDETAASDELGLQTDTVGGINGIEWAMIDAVLISNSHSLIMLPYITGIQNFRGKVLTTGPVLRLGKILIDDLFAVAENLSSAALESVQKSLPDSRRWLLRYTKDQAANALSKVQTLAYHEYVDLFGLIKVKCVSAGYEIGSSNWVIKTDTEKLVYISRSSLYSSFAMPMDFSEFSELDVLIIGSVNTSDSLPFEAAMEYFKTITVQTLARGGHVMLPTLPSGLIYYLLEAVASARDEFDGNLLSEFDKPISVSVTKGAVGGSGADKAAPIGGVSLVGKVAKCPCLFISTQAKASLAYANASGEWLAADRESALYSAESPFLFDTWIRNHHLATLASLHSTPGQQTGGGGGSEKKDSAWVEGGLWPSYPTVFLSGHPSCRLGPAVHLIRALSLGTGRQRPTQQQQQCSNTNALILVQSDEFCDRKRNGHEQLRQILEPLKSFTEAITDWGEETILQLPVHRLGVGLTAYWLPLRLDISIAQLPALLANCGTPKQAFLVPLEVNRGAKASLSSGAKGIGWRQSLDIELATPSMVRVYVDTEVLSSRCAFAMAAAPATTTATGATSASVAKDPRRARDTPTHVALVEGRLCFRDGKYRLEPPELDGPPIAGERGTLSRSVTSPPQSPKRSSSPSGSTSTSSPLPACTAEAVGTYRMLLSKTSSTGGVAVDANRLVKHLTESGVTGAQVIADAALLDSFLTTYRHLHRRLPPHLLPPIGATAKNTALIVFPNSTTTILLTAGSSHITCQDEGTRVAIRNSLLACAPHMLAVPSAAASTTSTPLH